MFGRGRDEGRIKHNFSKLTQYVMELNKIFVDKRKLFERGEKCDFVIKKNFTHSKIVYRFISSSLKQFRRNNLSIVIYFICKMRIISL